MIVYLVEREDPTRAFDRVGDQSADAVGELGSEKIFDDVSFEIGPGRARRAVEEKRPKAVVEIGVHQRPLLPQRSHNADRFDGLDRRDIGPLPHRRFVGEELRKIPDRRHAGAERRHRVYRRGGKADDEVSHVRLDRRGLPHLPPVPLGLKVRPRFLRRGLSQFRRQRHAAVEADTGAVKYETVFFGEIIYFAQGRHRLIPCVHADVGVIHDAPLFDAPALIFKFRRNVIFIHKFGAADVYLRGKPL
ncbi:hypothetical protein SDC9_110251 [bioreactor metagenome]|uniref:Uncharacterized protein n=1 Tax=bioreactor metagenome TaxID=1076179 RepID=A0A645BFF2_9ZZZZ